MRSWLCALLLVCPLAAQQVTSEASDVNGTFFVDGIVYRYAVGPDYTVVVAAHSVVNRKFLAVKIRVYNTGRRSVTVRPEDVDVSDAISGRKLIAVPGPELARKMRRPQNMARYSVNGVAGTTMDGPITRDMALSWMETMKMMAAHPSSRPSQAGKTVLYTDAPGALQEDVSAAVDCDQVCRLRNAEAMVTDPLNQLQRPSSPDWIEQFALLANTVPPHANAAGLLYYPLGKLSEAPPVTPQAKKDRRVYVTVSLMGETFPFELAVE